MADHEIDLQKLVLEVVPPILRIKPKKAGMSFLARESWLSEPVVEACVNWLYDQGYASVTMRDSKLYVWMEPDQERRYERWRRESGIEREPDGIAIRAMRLVKEMMSSAGESREQRPPR